MGCLVAAGERVEQVLWVLDHEADLDADFLAIYGIDLDVYDMDGPRYLALAHRLPAYQGVMAARVDEERDDAPASSSAAPAVQDYQPPQASGDRREVSLTAFRMQFPGLVSIANG
jgi:hypothetical protein